MGVLAAPPGSDLGETVIGLDAVEVPRFRRMLDRRPRLSERLFSPAELSYARRFTDPAPHLAARFAAKEAALKAMGVGLGAVRFRDLEVERAASGAPRLRAGGLAQEIARAQGVTGWSLSLTHTALLAVAVVVARREPATPRDSTPRPASTSGEGSATQRGSATQPGSGAGGGS